LTEEHDKVMQKSWQRTQDRQWQQKHRAVVHNRMIASGWKPNQKCVSLSSTLLKYDQILTCNLETP
jgi:hypothetical protein